MGGGGLASVLRQMRKILCHQVVKTLLSLSVPGGCHPIYLSAITMSGGAIADDVAAQPNPARGFLGTHGRCSRFLFPGLGGSEYLGCLSSPKRFIPVLAPTW